MDTTFVAIILIVFLVVAGLAIDIGYMYVGEEELQHTAEMAALAGAQSLKQRMLQQLQRDPDRLLDLLRDPVQPQARLSARRTASGNHDAVALIELASDDSNLLGSANDITVGFWNMSTHSYTAGGKPVNAIQVRARRTAESATVGLGALGEFLSRISGIDSHNYTPVVTAAFTPRARAAIALSPGVCGGGCTYPRVCAFPERRLERRGWVEGDERSVNYAFTGLRYQPADTGGLSAIICLDAPPQEVCGKPVSVTLGGGDGLLRDLAAVMYNRDMDRGNKEFDPATGEVTGWWVILPVTAGAPRADGSGLELHETVRYALARISRICAAGPAGCGGTHAAPASLCKQETGDALYIDRITCVDCDAGALTLMPGLHPALVR